MSVILIGFMGSGKTSVGRQLSEDFIDLDHRIEEYSGEKISSFFTHHSQAEFRVLESEQFEKALLEKRVIATGGGLIEQKKNQQLLMAQKQVVYLKMDFESLWRRILADAENVRPLAQNRKEKVEILFEKRIPMYEKVADLVLDVTGKSPVAIAQKIVAW